MGKNKYSEISIEKDMKKFSAMLTLNEGKLLFDLAKNSSEKGVIMEIGSYKGGSTILLAKGSKMGKKNKIYAIDPHTLSMSEDKIGEEIIPKDVKSFFLANIKKARCENKIIPIFKHSNQVAKKWNKPISLLWIDGDHNYSSVKKDILAWEKYLINGGILAFHDSAISNNRMSSTKIRAYKFPGVQLAVKLFIINSGRFKNIKVTDTITSMQKIRKATHVESLKNIIDLKGYVYLLKITLNKKTKGQINRLIGLAGISTKKIYPKAYTFFKPYFPDKT